MFNLVEVCHLVHLKHHTVSFHHRQRTSHDHSINADILKKLQFKHKLQNHHSITPIFSNTTIPKLPTPSIPDQPSIRETKTPSDLPTETISNVISSYAAHLISATARVYHNRSVIQLHVGGALASSLACCSTNRRCLLFLLGFGSLGR